MSYRRFQDLSEEDRELLREALEACDLADAPYSGFLVGAALRADDGRVFLGANSENAAFGASLCAERTAYAHARAEGYVHRCVAIAIVTRRARRPTKKAATPCGECRQVLSDAAWWQGIGKDFKVFLAPTKFLEGEVIKETTIGRLLPDPFSPEDLGMKRNKKTK
ncbi:MAG: cytidine deaminase [Candidatus Wildermuthbacteria bacterium]|nr:cytidine deaminase [Candidatus Wildermuthbacteria bacterium]